MSESIDVVVVYALPDRQELVALRLPAGSTGGQAVRASGLLQKYPDIDLEHNKLGVFGKLVGIDAPLRTGDRIEIYRPLIADPKEIRRQRAAAGKAMKRGGDSARPD
ncbi:MAG: Protein RnfH [Rhodocyclaceae bacterium]|nr:RnfH family protein [Rhodocyclaceae bacterium]MCG3188096.1 Protein RnfH [Rhodocyclaceae bacterium]